MNQIWPKITLKTPLEELIAIHKRIWDTCIEEYGGLYKPKAPYLNGCVACEIANLRFKESPSLAYTCTFCPMFYLMDNCCRKDSLFNKWFVAASQPEKKYMAQQIRDYKWREENG